MKGGLAVMLACWRHRSAWRTTCSACFTTPKKARPSAAASRRSVAQVRCSTSHLALCLEPTDGELQSRLHRWAAGASHRDRAPSPQCAPWQGENAIYAALPLLSRLAGLKRREVVVEGLTFTT